jgi:hypothetical protein
MPYRQSAVAAGVLLILGVVASLVATRFTGPILSQPDYLGVIPSSENNMLWGTFFQFITALVAAGIALSLYPVLRRYHSTLAVGAVTFRIMEGVFYAISGLGLIALVTLGHESSVREAPYYQSLGSLIISVSDAANFIFGVVAFGLGATMYYVAFYLTKLVPRWLTIWGFAGIILVVSAAVYTLLNGEAFAIEGNMRALAAPIALQELVLACWLSIRGFNLPSDSRID